MMALLLSTNTLQGFPGRLQQPGAVAGVAPDGVHGSEAA